MKVYVTWYWFGNHGQDSVEYTELISILRGADYTITLDFDAWTENVDVRLTAILAADIAIVVADDRNSFDAGIAFAFEKQVVMLGAAEDVRAPSSWLDRFDNVSGYNLLLGEEADGRTRAGEIAGFLKHLALVAAKAESRKRVS